MPLIMPALVYDPRTRVAAEVLAYYNIGEVYKAGTIGISAPNTFDFLVEQSCAGSDDTPPASGVWIARARTPIKALTDITITIDGQDAVMPALAPLGHAVEFEAPLSAPIVEGDITVAGGLAGDSIDIMALPNPATDVLLCFSNGFNAEVGEENRPIPRGFLPVDHYVRQRPTNTISLAEFYQSNRVGLSYLRNRDVTIILRTYPDGGATPLEIAYYSRVRLSVPKDIPQDGNESIQVNATGTFREFAIFSADPE